MNPIFIMLDMIMNLIIYQNRGRKKKFSFLLCVILFKFFQHIFCPPLSRHLDKFLSLRWRSHIALATGESERENKMCFHYESMKEKYLNMFENERNAVDGAIIWNDYRVFICFAHSNMNRVRWARSWFTSMAPIFI